MSAQLHVHPSEQTLLHHEKCSRWVSHRPRGKETVKCKRRGGRGGGWLKGNQAKQEVLHFWNFCQQMVYKAVKSPFDFGFHTCMKARSSWTRFLQRERLTSYQRGSASWSVNRNPGAQEADGGGGGNSKPTGAQVQLNWRAHSDEEARILPNVQTKCLDVWSWQSFRNLPPFFC